MASLKSLKSICFCFIFSSLLTVKARLWRDILHCRIQAYVIQFLLIFDLWFAISYLIVTAILAQNMSFLSDISLSGGGEGSAQISLRRIISWVSDDPTLPCRPSSFSPTDSWESVMSSHGIMMVCFETRLEEKTDLMHLACNPSWEDHQWPAVSLERDPCP